MSYALEGVALRAGGHVQGRVLVERLDARMDLGERWVLLGPNGAGKSTLLAALAGLIAPAAGRVRYAGRDLAAWPRAALACERAWCPQFWSDPFPARVDETVRLARPQPAWGAAPPPGEAAALAGVLERLDLGALAGADVRSLSGGERQRVAVATALWQGTPWLLLDEPASHLDLAHQQALAALLAERSAGGLVASLHELNLAWSVATHALLLDGRGGAHAGPRDDVMTTERLSAAFGVAIARVEVCGVQRFWVGP